MKQKIARKPKPKVDNSVDVAALDAIISQGTGFPEDKDHQVTSKKKRVGRPPSRVKKTKVLLSLPDALLEKLDSYLEETEYSGSRSDWLRQAIEEKLETTAK